MWSCDFKFQSEKDDLKFEASEASSKVLQCPTKEEIDSFAHWVDQHAYCLTIAVIVLPTALSRMGITMYNCLGIPSVFECCKRLLLGSQSTVVSALMLLYI